MAEKKENELSKSFKKLSKNYWAISTIILAALLVIVLLTGNGTTVSANEAGQKMLNFALEQYPNTTLVSVNNSGEFYEVVLLINGQEVPVQVTKDGENLIPQLIPLTARATQDTTTEQPAQTEVPKSDRPVVELYVFTYCPYGTQSEKGIIPVVNLLGDKIDFRLRQIGAMHGEHEKIEAERQLCIEQEQPDKLLNYVLDFAQNEAIGKCSSDTTCSDPLVNTLFTKLGINKAKIESCIKTDGETLYTAEEANSKNKGVGGSPTLIINGVNTQSGRDSASYLATICNAFAEAPEECNEELSSASPTPGFGASTSTASSTGAQC